MHRSEEDAETQPQHKTNTGGLLAECKGGTRERKEGTSEVFEEICQLLNLPLALVDILRSSLAMWLHTYS